MLIHEKDETGNITNTEIHYREGVAMPSIREMCDPRVQIAAKICLENNFCRDHFASSDFNVALHRVNRRLTLKRTVSKA